MGGKLNRVNYIRLIRYHVDIIDGIRDIFIEMSKYVVSDEDICFITNKYKVFPKEIDEAYCSMRSLNVNDDVIYKTKKNRWNKQCLYEEKRNY